MEAQLTFSETSKLAKDSPLLWSAAQLIISEICELGDTCDFDPEDIERAIRDMNGENRTTVIVHDDEQVLAVGVMEVYEDEAVVVDVATDPDNRGEGLGKKVIEMLGTIAKRAGATRLVGLSLESAVGFYEAIGCQRDAPGAYGFHKSLQD